MNEPDAAQNSETTTSADEVMNLDSQTEIFELMSKNEPLHPELQKHVVVRPGIGKVIHHPLLIEMFFDENKCAFINKRYEFLKKCMTEFAAKEDWHAYVFRHERPYRLNAFLRIAEELDEKTYWDIVGSIWTDSENIFESFETWIEIWSSRSGSHLAMDDAERTFLAGQPDEFTIWRGYQHDESAIGLSWSLKKSKAQWFAKRWSADTPMLAKGTVRRGDVLAYFSGRNEHEVVVLPEFVKVVSVG